MKKIIGFLILVFCCSCDPMDDRMEFVNNSKSDINIRMFFLNGDEINETMVGLRKVKSKETQKIGILYKWESEFKKVKPDTLLNVIIYKNYKILDDKHERSSLVKSNSLFRIGQYEYKTYTYKQLENKNWKINYPDDVFRKGRYRPKK